MRAREDPARRRTRTSARKDGLRASDGFAMVGEVSEGEYVLLAASPERWFQKAPFSSLGGRSGLCDGVDLPWFECEGLVTFGSRALLRVLRSYDGRSSPSR